MNKRINVGWYLAALLAVVIGVFNSCQSRNQGATHTGTHCVKEASLPVKYARGFSVDYYNGFKVITVRDIKDSATELAQYVLLPKGKQAPVDFTNAVLLDTPVRKVVCVATNHITALDMLGLADSIAGVANVELIFNQRIADKVKQGLIASIGSGEPNYEKIVELNPAFVITSGSWDGGDKMKVKLNSLHLKSVLNVDYMEQEPLARAEWLKFTAAFYDKEAEADSIFSQIEARYLALKAKAQSVSQQPTVFVNIPFKEIWYMPCGDNYMTRIIADAGGNFLWKNDTANNGLNLNLDYEAVYARAANADYWLCNGFVRSLADIEAADKKNTFFKAYQTGKVYNTDKRGTPAGGFDFWESGTTAPDKVLADMIYIFHPELLPEHQLYYYRKLQ